MILFVFLSCNIELTVDVDVELLRVVGRDAVEGLAHVDPHVGAIDVRNVEDGRWNKTG